MAARKDEDASTSVFVGACLLAVCAGCGTSIQSGVNVSLSRHARFAGSESYASLCAALFAGLMSFSGGWGVLVVCNAADSLARPGPFVTERLRCRDVIILPASEPMAKTKRLAETRSSVASWGRR